MKSRLSLALVISSGLVLGACGPYADRDLSYKQIDEAFLADTTVVIAASHGEWSSRTYGATLFVKRDGTVQRIDNAGLNDVQLAHADGRVGFSDLERDYILGRDRVVSKRNTLEGGWLIGTGFVSENLVSVIGNAEPADAEVNVVTRTGGGPAVSKYRGSAEAAALCDNGMWVFGRSVEGEPGYLDESAEETASAFDLEQRTVMARPMKPTELAPIAVSLKSRYEYSVVAAACDQNRLVGISADWNEGEFQVLSVDVASRKSASVEVTGYLDETLAHSENETTIEAATFKETDLYVVASTVFDKGPRYVLVRINTETGESEKITSIKKTADVNTLFRFEGNVLYVLDVTWRDPSRVRAFSVADGIEVGSLEFDWIEPKLNSRFTTEERTLEVLDFVVLQPGLVSDLSQEQSELTAAD